MPLAFMQEDFLVGLVVTLGLNVGLSIYLNVGQGSLEADERPKPIMWPQHLMALV